MNTPTLAELEKAVQQLQAQINELRDAAAKQVKPDVRYDAYGRLLKEPEKGTQCFYSDNYIENNYDIWEGLAFQKGMISTGAYFISREAAKAELTRLECLQRLRGMPGHSPDNGDFVCEVSREISLWFVTYTNAEAAEESLTEAERAAFNYREPGHAE